MMGSSSKHLKQLLNEDQEPFVLHNYIQEKRSQLNKQPLKTKLQLNKTQTQPRNICKDVCFFSFHDSSNLTKSPLFDFSKKSPCRGSGSNTVFVHIPAKTAALLLEAALRIQSQSENKKSSKNIGFGFFGSILKRIRRRKKQPSERCSETEIKVSVKDILRWEPSDVCTVERAEEEEIDLGLEERRVSDVGLCCSRVSSAWSESNEEKSLDLETSTSSCSEETEQGRESKIGEEEEEEGPEFNLCEKRSPLRLILESGLSPRRRSPELLSPATSPNRRKHQVVKKEEEHLSSDGKEEKEEKEHCSPVSVLDIQLEDEVEEQDEDEEEEDYDDSELERSFAFVKKAKRKLLQKLRRFELLAELDPLELEKRIAEDYNDDEDEDEDDDEDDSDDEENDKDDDDSLLQEENCSNHMTVPLDMKRLVIDLMRGEGAVAETSHRALVTNECCMRMGSLKNVERRTINGMVEMDFKGERNEWQKNTELVEETVMEVELAIFSFLVEEFSVELVHFSDIF